MPQEPRERAERGRRLTINWTGGPLYFTGMVGAKISFQVIRDNSGSFGAYDLRGDNGARKLGSKPTAEDAQALCQKEVE